MEPLRPVTIFTPPKTAPRFHLLLAHGGTEDTFRELVAATGIIGSEGAWFATVDGALDVSSIEADARLARWSRRTGRLAMRITRTDPTRWWLAVHHDGQRLFAMVHTHGILEQLMPETAILTDAELGRDPLLDLLSAPGTDRGEVRGLVAQRRAEQLSAALAVGDVHVPAEYLARILRADDPPDGNIPSLLAQIEGKSLYDLVTHVQGSSPGPVAAAPGSIQSVVSKAIMLGCVLPALVGTGFFVAFSRYAVKSGASPAAALLFGGIAAWVGMWGARQLLGGRAVAGQAGWQKRSVLSWAAQAAAPPARPIRPTASALDTWGGLFYLLRDIAFFSGIDRPQGPLALYVEAWGLGPPALVDAINRAVADGATPQPLFDAAHELVTLRQALIDRHLAGEKIASEETVAKVKTILAPAIA